MPAGPAPRDEREPTSLHDLLLEWPYARDYLLTTMDRDLIESHGFMHLSRALNIGTVVAFLGAGVSMAYGRISWKNLVNSLVKDADQVYKTLNRKGLAGPRHKTLYDNLNELQLEKRPPGGDLKSDRYPSVFQLCFELMRELAYKADFSPDKHRFLKSATTSLL